MVLLDDSLHTDKTVKNFVKEIQNLTIFGYQWLDISGMGGPNKKVNLEAPDTIVKTCPPNVWVNTMSQLVLEHQIKPILHDLIQSVGVQSLVVIASLAGAAESLKVLLNVEFCLSVVCDVIKC